MSKPDAKTPPSNAPAKDAMSGIQGEGNYEATRRYNAGVKDHVQHHDMDKDAREAAPKNATEAKEMEEAERIGKSRSRGEDASQSEKVNQDRPDKREG